MNLLLVLLLLQDRPVENSIDAFLKGDDAARAELLKLGVYAIRPLLKIRDKNPKAVEPLLFELKKAAAEPTPTRFDAELGGVRILGGIRASHLMRWLSAVSIPCFLDPAAETRCAGLALTLRGGTLREIADEVCRQTGLDYGYFHNSVIFATPERLWPDAPVPDRGEVKGADLERARKLIEQLGHELLEEREAASRELRALGMGVLPLLEAQLKRNDPEIAARCLGLIREIRPKRGAFGPPGARRQALDESARKLLDRMAEARINLRIDNQPLGRFIEILNASQPVKCELAAELAAKPISFDVRQIPAADLLAVITQSLDLDFMVHGSGVLIDTREAIEKRLSPPK